MPIRIDLTYFKLSGKVYASDWYFSHQDSMNAVVNEVKRMNIKGKLPGLELREGPSEFHILVNGPSELNSLPPRLIPSIRHEKSEKENTVLRGLVAKFAPQCIYCGERDMSRCSAGFPGCSKMDDLMVATCLCDQDMLALYKSKFKIIHDELERRCVRQENGGFTTVCDLCHSSASNTMNEKLIHKEDCPLRLLEDQAK